MRRTVAALAIASFGSLAAQTPATPPASPPEGWTISLDDATKTDTKFVTMGQGFHVTNGMAAGIYFHPKNVATGSYSVGASFGQRTAPAMGHPEAYGVFVGGSQLDDATKQSYMYFEVRGDGKFYVAHRAGKDVHKIVEWTEHAAVKKQNEAGAVTNEIGIKVTADSVQLMANGTMVKGFAKSELHGFNTDGQYGLRVNHGLNVHIGNFGLQK